MSYGGLVESPEAAARRLAQKLRDISNIVGNHKTLDEKQMAAIRGTLLGRRRDGAQGSAPQEAQE
jgi:hypothetical protein